MTLFPWPNLAKSSHDIKIACKTKNVVYLLTCAKCGIQYVGMTTQTINSRFDGHRTKIRNKKVFTALCQHFRKECHTLSDIKVQIIYHFKGKDEDAKEVLLHVEDFYMKKLATVMPFGLNDHITDLNINLSSYDYQLFNRANTPFFPYPHPRKKRSHGHRKNSKIKITHSYLKELMDKMVTFYKEYKLHDLYSLLRSSSKEVINICLKLVKPLFDQEDSHKINILSQILLAYNSRNVIPISSEKEDFIYFTIPFIHKVFEKVGIREIVNHRDLKVYLPKNAKKLNIRTTFSYGPKIGRKIFNYNKVLSVISNKDLKNDTCDCQDNFAAFVYGPHNHVHTGNLEIIQNEDLRNIMSKGAKYRLTPSITRSKLLSHLEETVTNLREKLISITKDKEGCFDIWSDIFQNKIRKRCKMLNKSDLEGNDIFQKEEVTMYLRYLQERFVIVPVDKASNNFAVICKTFYIQVLMKELGVNKKGIISGNKVYRYVPTSRRQFFIQQEAENKALGNTLEEENKHIPLLYWTSKQHKNPYKFRFIAGASHCPSKTISIEVALALKCIKTHFKNYCAKIKRNTGYNYFWSIDNSLEFSHKLQFLQAQSIKTFDFSTLYTTLTLNAIYDGLEQLISKMFKVSGSLGIMVNDDVKKSFWSDGSDRPNYKLYTMDKLLDSLKYVLYNTYVQFAGHVFLQTQGIPMGGNASPFIADLFLAWQEYCFMDSLVKSKTESNLKLAEQLSLNSRYLDDIAVINFLSFGVVAKLIYHSSLLLEESDFGYHYDHFLDLNIRIVNGRFVIGIYHKVDDFDFEVISFPFPSSNIHSQVGYTSFYSQLVRYFRLCNNITDFIVRVKMLKNKLSSRGYNLVSLRKCFLRFCRTYPAPLKYGPTDEALWDMTKGNVFGGSCCVYDQDAVKALTKPCIVRLQDLYINDKKLHVKNTEGIEKSVTQISCISPNDGYENFCPPIPLANPRNHCYLNSTLQVLFRLKDILFTDVLANNNPEGRLVLSLSDSLHSASECEMANFKSNLSRYNQFFDGVLQRDAHECFQLVLNILHQGTRRSILGSDSDLVENDEFMTSVTKSNFSFVFKKILTCINCKKSSVFYIPSSDLNVYPSNSRSLESLIFETMKSTIQKGCECSSENTDHSEWLEFEELPNILFIIVNRYSFNSRVSKNKCFITINTEIRINERVYDHLATIYHHGETTSSGHYTTKLSYTDAAYICDDLNVTSVDILENEKSKSCYVILYVGRD